MRSGPCWCCRLGANSQCKNLNPRAGRKHRNATNIGGDVVSERGPMGKAVHGHLYCWMWVVVRVVVVLICHDFTSKKQKVAQNKQLGLRLMQNTELKCCKWKCIGVCYTRLSIAFWSNFDNAASHSNVMVISKWFCRSDIYFVTVFSAPSLAGRLRN